MLGKRSLTQTRRWLRRHIPTLFQQRAHLVRLLQPHLLGTPSRRLCADSARLVRSRRLAAGDRLHDDGVEGEQGSVVVPGEGEGGLALARQRGPVDDERDAAAVAGSAALAGQVDAQVLSDRVEHRVFLDVAHGGLGGQAVFGREVVRLGLVGLGGLVRGGRVVAGGFRLRCGRVELVERIGECLLLFLFFVF